MAAVAAQRRQKREFAAVAVEDGGSPRRQQSREQPLLGGAVMRHVAVVIEVVAGQIGERARGEAHAVEPLLVETVGGGLHGEMGDAARGEPVEELVQRDRVRRGQRPVDGELARHDAERPDRGGFEPKRLPDLAHEGDDRGLSAGAGDRDDGLGLARVKASGGVSEGGAGVADLDEGGVRDFPPAFGHDRRRAFRQRLADMLEAVVLRAGKGEEYVAGQGLPAVEREPDDGPRSERAVGVLELEDVAKPSHRRRLTPCWSFRHRLHTPVWR
jgi:hypothetical protein